jgi:hypothetical protein
MLAFAGMTKKEGVDGRVRHPGVARMRAKARRTGPAMT